MVMKNYINMAGITFSRPRMGTTNVWNGVPASAYKGNKTVVVNANSKKKQTVKSGSKKSNKRKSK
jgi:hypothetical protein